MGKKFLIANWKMQLTEKESDNLAEQIKSGLQPTTLIAENLELVLCPSHLALNSVADKMADSGIKVGAQDVFWKDKGAFTGEISPVTLKELGAQYCIVGHSERRTQLNETDEMVRLKTEALLRQNINPIICVGETLAEREAGKRDAVIINQVRAALGNGAIQPIGTQQIIIAYEPIWVIGTGQAVEPTDAAIGHQLIRDVLAELYPSDVVQRQCFVIYGGSIDASNIEEFLAIPIIEGALVGGASLKADEFVKMAEITVKHS